MDRKELKICILDLETLRALGIIGGYIPHQDRWVMWEISKRKNELDSAVKFLREEPIDYYVTFNGVPFDLQVLQYIFDNYEKWYDKTWDQILELVYQFVQNMISNQDYEIPPPYKEQYMDIRSMDMFLILHMNNENRRTSLKWCMYSMDEDIELMDADHGKKDLSVEELEQTIYYWKNDIRSTWNLYKYCTGECDHPDYKGKDKIQLRLDLIEEMRLPWTAINWNDVKIGDELNKRNYLDLAGIDNKKLWEKVKNRKTKTGFKFKECYPSYIKFETKEFQELFKRVGETVVNLNQKQEFPFIYNGTHYTVAKGGGHSGESARMLISDDEYIICDADVGSMYPNIIRKRGIYPAHLGPKWNEAYISNIAKRLHAKKMYKETGDKKWDNLQETYKLVLNGSFGKLIDRTNWQYDPYAGMRVTIGGQVDIFMLAEDLEMAGIHVVSLNTDGVTVQMRRDQVEQYYQICKAWEREVGNNTMGNLEYVEYSKLVQTSVNDYIAVKRGEWKEDENGVFRLFPNKSEPEEKKIKKKGSFLTSYELHKNKSNSIVPIALEKYYVHGIPVERTVKNHTNIYDYCIAKKASRDYYYQGIDKLTGKVNQYKKLIRYYCSKGIGEKLYKMKHEHSEKTGPKQSNCEATSKLQVVCNKKPVYADIKELGIDYEWYISQCKKIIHQIEPEVKRADTLKAKQQISMF